MALPIIVGNARRRHGVGGMLAGAERHGNADQRSGQAERVPAVGGYLDVIGRVIVPPQSVIKP